MRCCASHALKFMLAGLQDRRLRMLLCRQLHNNKPPWLFQSAVADRCSPEKQNKNKPSVTGTPDQLTNGGCLCVNPVTVAPSQPTSASRATEANIPPTDRKDSRDRSRSHTVGNTSSAANNTSVCTAGRGSTTHNTGQDSKAMSTEVSAKNSADASLAFEPTSACRSANCKALVAMLTD